MKDFSHINNWLRTASFSDLTNTISRAVSRVTNARNDIFKLEPEYVSGYNSIQTLGYNSQGEIEDQTSSERLTIPEGVLSKYEAILRQYRRALSVDRDQFTAELKSSPALLTTLIPALTLQNSNSQNVVNLGGIVSLVVFRENDRVSARASVPAYIARLLNTNISTSKLSRLPTIGYVNDSNELLVMEWSNAHIYPVPTIYGDTAKKWRVILFRYPNQPYHLIVNIQDDRLYTFDFTGATLTDNSLIFRNVDNSNESFTSISEFESLLYRVGFPSNSFSPVYIEVDQNAGWVPDLIPWNDMSQSMKDIFQYLFSGTWSETTFSEPIFKVSTSESTFKDIFDLISTITPESLDDLINYLS
jgi:hypothetical protein